MLGRPRKAVLKNKYSRNVYGLGHLKKGSTGYMVRVVGGEHPRANIKGEIFEHLLVAEKALGRPLDSRHRVHHVNENRSDNRPCNLVICEDLKYHFLLHSRLKALRATGNVHSKKCGYCGKWVVPDTPDAKFFHRTYVKDGWASGHSVGYHRSCKSHCDKQYRQNIRKGASND